jgi:hypothetical protein
MGLDPGMDHMSAMKVIHEVQERGDAITHFSSVCGGLPAPEAADNPFGYKFSWSPRGVMSASGNSARYLEEGEIKEVEGKDLLASVRPSASLAGVLPALALEELPNRDSVPYAAHYGIDHTARTVYVETASSHSLPWSPRACSWSPPPPPSQRDSVVPSSSPLRTTTRVDASHLPLPSLSPSLQVPRYASLQRLLQPPERVPLVRPPRGVER